MSSGLTVEHFSKVENIMSEKSFGYASCFASPSFKYIGKGISILEDEKLIDLYQTFKKLPKNGNRKKVAEEEITLTVHRIEKDVESEEESISSSSEDETEEIITESTNSYKIPISETQDDGLAGSFHHDDIKDESNSSDSESSLCSDSDAVSSSEAEDITMSDDYVARESKTRVIGVKEFKEPTVIAIPVSDTNCTDVLDTSVEGDEKSVENNGFKVMDIVEGMNTSVTVVEKKMIPEQSIEDLPLASEKFNQAENVEESVVKSVNNIELNTRSNLETLDQCSYTLNQQLESPNKSFSDKGTEAREEEAELLNSGCESEEDSISSTESAYQSQKSKENDFINQLTAILETESPELAESIVVLRLESMLENMLILNEENISDGENSSDEELEESDIELSNPPDPDNAEAQLCNEKATETEEDPKTEDKIETEVLQESVADEAPDPTTEVDEDENKIKDSMDSDQSELFAYVSDEENELGIEWVDYMKVFISNFFFSGAKTDGEYFGSWIDSDSTEALNADGQNYNESPSSSGSCEDTMDREMENDEDRVGDKEEEFGPNKDAQTDQDIPIESNTKSTEEQITFEVPKVDADEPEPVCGNMDTSELKSELSGEDFKSSDVEQGDSNSNENEDVENQRNASKKEVEADEEPSSVKSNESSSIENKEGEWDDENIQIHLATSNAVDESFQKKLKLMKHDFERIIKDISTHGIYPIFSIITCFFHDYMKSKFGHYTQEGLCKILQVISASLRCPIQPTDYHVNPYIGCCFIYYIFIKKSRTNLDYDNFTNDILGETNLSHVGCDVGSSPAL